MAVLRVVDERFSATPSRVPALELRLASERTTARDIIRRRVETEVAKLNDQAGAPLGNGSFLIASEATEARLNAPRSSGRRKPIEVETEISRATTAFLAGGFVMLLDDRQLEGLDEEIGLRTDSEVVFLYLTPLKGG